MPSKIDIPVDYKRPEWRALADGVIAAGSVKHLRGTPPPGLPAGGYWEYRKRAAKGRLYLVYNLRAGNGNEGRAYVIASVDPEFASAAMCWQPKPHAKHEFNFDSGPIVVHYDALAMPHYIEPVR